MHSKQGVALTGGNRTVLLCSVVCGNGHGPGLATVDRPRVLQTMRDDADSMQNNTGPLGEPVIILDVMRWNIALFATEVCLIGIGRLPYALYGISAQPDNDWNYIS